MKLTFDLFCCLEKTTGAIAMLEEKIRHVEKEAEQAKKVQLYTSRTGKEGIKYLSTAIY